MIVDLLVGLVFICILMIVGVVCCTCGILFTCLFVCLSAFVSF